MDSALYVARSLVRFRDVNNSRVNTVHALFPWSNLYVLHSDAHHSSNLDLMQLALTGSRSVHSKNSVFSLVFGRNFTVSHRPGQMRLSKGCIIIYLLSVVCLWFNSARDCYVLWRRKWPRLTSDKIRLFYSWNSASSIRVLNHML